ncbi:type IV pilus assembly protein PilM [Haliangium ochraceum]|uniref:Type IV pilus assembly protein PilM n=1 Tax=Haliangium ochraceum (strain DSM 14365 / JCM 11303 / SMP-2) TaxID=502025 RepID=D0LHM7_HALO1|nr:type IV pilus assembly protein PilM [Haliangium ochraceum]ACY12889.1 type IV pilus assembly protein PilM [Haliangium ochraceum DSM 14365]
MAKNCIGLDIGSSSIKAIQLKKRKRGLEVCAFGMEPLAPQTIVDGTIMDQTAVVEAIRALWKRLKLRQRDVAIAIAGHSVIIKKISVPRMSSNELAEQIPQEAEHHIPFSRDDVEIDYEVVLEENLSGQMDLLLVAAKKDVVADYTQVVKDASLVPQVVDVAAFTAQNGFEANYQLRDDETVILINIGAAISNINIIRGTQSLFTRDVTIGGNLFTEELQKQLSLSYEEAEAYKVGGGPNEQGVVPEPVEQVIESVADVMAGEFQRSLDFFLATSAETNVTRVCLAGGTSKAPALHRAIAQHSRLPVEVIDAWRNVSINASLDSDFLAAHAPEALIGVGLALRAGNDK